MVHAAVLTNESSGTPITAGIDGTTVRNLCKVIYVESFASGQRELLSRSRARISIALAFPALSVFRDVACPAI
jgi:hypothetical protein